MTNDQKTPDLDRLKQRLEQAKDAQKSEDASKEGQGKSMGYAYRLAFELVLAVVVGAYIGWLLDGWFETKPLWMIVFFFFGIAAGIKNVIRTADRMRAADNNNNDQKDRS